MFKEVSPDFYSFMPVHPDMELEEEYPMEDQNPPFGFDVEPTPTPTPGPGPGPTPPIDKDINYTQGYLNTKIGKRVKVEFLIGPNMLIDREGILKEVGISYIVLKEAGTNLDIMADIYSIKFVEIFE